MQQRSRVILVPIASPNVVCPPGAKALYVSKDCLPVAVVSTFVAMHRVDRLKDILNPFIHHSDGSSPHASESNFCRFARSGKCRSVSVRTNGTTAVVGVGGKKARVPLVQVCIRETNESKPYYAGSRKQASLAPELF
jgi:hypothetical protein